MAATTTAKQPQPQTASPPPVLLAQARAVARECYRGLKHRMSFDAKTMARLAELAAAHPWLEE